MNRRCCPDSAAVRPRKRRYAAPFAFFLLLSAGTAVAPAVQAQTLIHHYTFSAGDVADAIGGADGTLLNGATASGGTLTLNSGLGSYVQFGSHIVPTSGSYSVALFARQDSAPAGIVELISQGFSGGPGFYIGYAAPNFRITDSWGSTGIAFPTDTTLFHHFALTVDAANSLTSLYVDGVLRGTLGTALTTTTGGTDTRLGRQFAPFNEFFGGQMRDVRIYTGALNSGQVATIAAGNGLNAVPEPGTLALVALPLLAIAAVRRRGRQES